MIFDDNYFYSYLLSYLQVRQYWQILWWKKSKCNMYLNLCFDQWQPKIRGSIVVTLKYIFVIKSSISKCIFHIRVNRLKFRPDFLGGFIEEKQVLVSKKAENGNCIGWKEKKLVAQKWKTCSRYSIISSFKT